MEIKLLIQKSLKHCLIQSKVTRKIVWDTNI